MIEDTEIEDDEVEDDLDQETLDLHTRKLLEDAIAHCDGQIALYSSECNAADLAELERTSRELKEALGRL